MYDSGAIIIGAIIVFLIMMGLYAIWAVADETISAYPFVSKDTKLKIAIWILIIWFVITMVVLGIATQEEALFVP